MILVTNGEGYSGCDTTARLLTEGRPALDAIEAGIRLVEADERVRTVGRGGWANILGEVELDAAVMDGTSLRTGAVGAVLGFAHPVSIARAVMERLPHELLVGRGAEMFAREIGAERADNLLGHAEEAWQTWFEAAVVGPARERWPESGLIAHVTDQVQTDRPAGTTIFIARDKQSAIASGVSTSGWQWKHPGRLGDSPLIGAGTYADSRYGACGCTGVGEMAIRCGTARSVVLYMKKGASVHDAVAEAVEDMRALRGGLIGRITIHAIDHRDQHRVVAVNGDGRNDYFLWREGEAGASRQRCEPIPL